jgi:uncharacterized protein (DUF58 family)
VRIRPGANLVRVMLMLALLSPLCFFWWHFGWCLLLGLVVVAGFAYREYQFVRAMIGSMKIRRNEPVVVGRDVAFYSEITLVNQGAQPIKGDVRDVLPSAAIPDYCPFPVALAPGGSLTRPTRLRIPERGRYEFGPIWLRLAGPRQLVEVQKVFDCRGTVKVFPEGFVSKAGLSEDQRAQLLMLDKLTRVRQSGAGTEFECLSEYRLGDDPRRIDWRTTARIGHPIVRRYQVERHRDLIVLIDCGRLMGASTDIGSKLDCAIDSALMLAEVALRYGDRCGIGIFDDRVRGFRTPVSGVSSIRTLAESIYNLQTQWRESDFGAMFAELQVRQTRRSLVVLLSDIVDVETTIRFRTSMARLSKRHVLLFAALRTPLLEQVVHSPVSTMLDGSRQAVAFELLKQRDQALHSLRHGGIHILDVEPSELTVPLINQFIDLRSQNLL